MTDSIDRFRPNLGIESVQQPPQALSPLPLEAQPDPTGGPVRDRLDELYPQDELERRLQAFVAPRLADPSILTPARFESLLKGALDALRGQVERDAHPEHEALLELLEREMRLRRQLASMRTALISA